LDFSSGFMEFLNSTGFFQCDFRNIIMILVGITLIYLAVVKKFEPLLLLPIGFGVIVGNIPFVPGMEIGVYEEGSVLNYLYQGVSKGIYPPLIFLGIGAMTDFSAMLSNPRLIFLGAAAQVGIFLALLGAVAFGFGLKEAGAIGIIGGADGPTAIFLASKLAPNLIGSIAITAYSYMALVPIIQPPIMRLLTTEKERKIKMKPTRTVTRFERVAFPVLIFITCGFIAPASLVLVGMLCLGNLLKESGVTERLANTARGPFIDAVTIILGFSVGASTQGDVFLKLGSIKIFALGAFAFVTATFGGVLFAKFMNLFLKDKINPLIGSAGISAVPIAARVSHNEAQKADPSNYLIMHAMAPNVAGVIGSAIAAGILLALLS
jgi:carboxybiotin decarboxylase